MALILWSGGIEELIEGPGVGPVAVIQNGHRNVLLIVAIARNLGPLAGPQILVRWISTSEGRFLEETHTQESAVKQ